jgi:hypothetical protein
LDHNGEQVLSECTRIKTMKRANEDGTFRFYNTYMTPAGDEVTMRLDTTEHDRARKLNRSENLRQTAPNDLGRFQGSLQEANDAESINRQLDDTLWLGRAHSKGGLRQSVNMLGYALYVNGLAVHLHRTKRSADGPEGNLPIAA